MSTWRKKETFKGKLKKETQKSETLVENFANIPMFDVLHNTQNEQNIIEPDMKNNVEIKQEPQYNQENPTKIGKKDTEVEETKQRETIEKPYKMAIPLNSNTNVKETIKEGFAFNFIGDDYFKNSKRNKLMKIDGVDNFIKKIMDYLLYPFENIDKILENFIYEILRIFLAFMLDKCNPRLQSSVNDEVKRSFVWMSKGARAPFTTMKEGFTVPKTNEQLSNLKTTIDNLFTIHVEQFKKDTRYNQYRKIDNVDMKDIDTSNEYNEKYLKACLGIYYLQRIQEKTPDGKTLKYGSELDKYELFDFNNTIDADLEKSEIRNAVFKIPYDDKNEWFANIYKLPKVKLIKPVNDTPDATIKRELTDCEKQQDAMKKSLQRYTKIIKEQLYMLFLIPISMYVVYNFYYLFFFKDYINSVKDENGGYTHGDLDRPFNAGGQQNFDGSGNPLPSSDCNHPIFPDWENIFHYFEKNYADILLEFIFKPVKLFYTSINAMKVLFRGKFKYPLFPTSTNMKDDLPYVFLLGTFGMVYYILFKYGSKILKLGYSLLKFDVNNVKLGKTNIKTLAFSITNLCLVFSLFRKGFGVNLQSMFNFFPNGKQKAETQSATTKTDSTNGSPPEQKSFFSNFTDKMTNLFAKNYDGLADPKKRSWLVWCLIKTTFAPVIIPDSSIISIFFKFIIMVLFWILKFVIATGMVPLSIYIFIIYFFYNMLFGVSDNADNTNDTSTKYELIDRIIYTKLYDIYDNIDPAIKIDKDEAGNPIDPVWYKFRDEKLTGFTIAKDILKLVCWIAIFFMTEIFALVIIFKGFTTFKNLPRGGRDPNELRFYNTLSTVLCIIYVVLGTLICLWCAYKMYAKAPKHMNDYRLDLFQRANDKSKFKSFEFDKNLNCRTEYDTQIKLDDPLFGYFNLQQSGCVFMNSDTLNEDYVKKYAERSSAIKRWSKKLGDFGNKMKKYLPDLNKIYSSFSSVDNTYKDLAEKPYEFKDKEKEKVEKKERTDARNNMFAKTKEGFMENTAAPFTNMSNKTTEKMNTATEALKNPKNAMQNVFKKFLGNTPTTPNALQAVAP